MQLLFTALKGMGMGMAEVVPGVSGGTIAFVTGIYERIMDAIKSINGALFVLLKQGKFKEAFQHIDGAFLISLFAGMGAGIVSGILFISYLLAHYPVLLWAFFFGLIIASCVFVAKQIQSWNGITIFFLVLGAAVSYLVTVMQPGNGNEALWFVFICGFIAISALMLPGLSGSFILLLMGMYTFILPTVKSVITEGNTEGMVIMAVFASGCLIGIFSFARIVSWAFKNHKNATLGLLIGFMVGSLNKLWPWQHVIKTRINSHGEEVAVLSKSISPSTFSQLTENFGYSNDPKIVGVIICAIFGCLLVFGLEKIGNSQQTDNPQ